MLLYGCIILILCYLAGGARRELIIQCVTSSPVEEMYHRQLITTLDSIFDARFDAECCEEVIDSDDINVPIDSLGRALLPDNWK